MSGDFIKGCGRAVYLQGSMYEIISLSCCVEERHTSGISTTVYLTYTAVYGTHTNNTKAHLRNLHYVRYPHEQHATTPVPKPNAGSANAESLWV